MFTAGLIMFSVYLGLHIIDELRFHRKCELIKSEYIGQCFDLAFILVCVGVVLFIEYGDNTRALYGIAAAISMVTISSAEKKRKRVCSPGEAWLHSWIYLLHPLMLATLGAIWPFVNGVSFFMNMIIPFSTKYLRLLCLSYFSAIGIFATYLLIYGTLIKKYPTDTSPVAAPDQPAT